MYEKNIKFSSFKKFSNLIKSFIKKIILYQKEASNLIFPKGCTK